MLSSWQGSPIKPFWLVGLLMEQTGTGQPSGSWLRKLWISGKNTLKTFSIPPSRLLWFGDVLSYLWGWSCWRWSKNSSWQGPGRVDEIRLEFLRVLDVVGLSWLTWLCNITWTFGAVSLGWQTRVLVPLLGNLKVCFNYWWVTPTNSLPGKIYSGVLERRAR